MEVAQSTPSPGESELFDSPPFTIREQDFFLKFRTTPRRIMLLEGFRQSLTQVRHCVDIDCLMIGGSFLSATNENPKDIDVSVFYRKKNDLPDCDLGDQLKDLRSSLLVKGIDARFVPTDGSVWILVKLTSFLTCLYTSQRGMSEYKRNGVIIVVPVD